MEPWQQWQEMARESEKAARLAEAEGCFRSSASRYYYAAYQAVTALLLYRGLTSPADREAWNHDVTPVLIREQLEPLIRSRGRRSEMAHRMRELYKLRIVADYSGTHEVPQAKLARARRDVGYLIKVIDSILPER